MLPVEGWTTSSLPLLLRLMKSGGTPDTSRSDYYGGDIPFVSIEDMTASGRHLTSTVKALTADGIKHSSAWIVPANSILYSIYATLGLPRINTIPVSTNQAILALVNDPNKIDRDYLYYWLEHIRASVVVLSTQTTQSNLSATIVKSFSVDHPTHLSEQAKISEILWTVDHAVEQTEALIAKQQRIKTALMQDLLTRGIDKHGNLRSVQTHQFKDSPLGRIPVEWEVTTLEGCVRNDGPICYGILMPGTGVDNGVPVIKVKDISGGKILQNQLLLAEPKIDDQYKRSRLRAGDLLITIRGTTGRIALVPPQLDKANITQDTARVRLKEEHSNQYFYFLLQGKWVQDQILLHTLGQAVKGINIAEVRKISFALPTQNEQQTIAGLLNEFERSMISTAGKLSKLRSLKTALMQHLLSGKKRVTALLDDTEVTN